MNFLPARIERNNGGIHIVLAEGILQQKASRFATFVTDKPLSATTMVYFKFGNEGICTSIDPELAPKSGLKVKLSLNMNQCNLFNNKTV